MNCREFKEKVYPDLESSLRKAIGKNVECHVVWDSLTRENFDEKYAEELKRVFFVPLIAACKNICRDEKEKESLKTKLEKVVFCNKNHLSGQASFSFVDGVLTIDHEVNNVTLTVDERIEIVTQILTGN